MTRKKEQSEIPILCLTAIWHPNGPKSGIKLRSTELGEFSDADAAALFLRDNNPAASFPWLFCYKLEPVWEYRGNGNPITIFDRNGNRYGGYDNENLDCFPGRLPEACRYKIGDIVMLNECRYLTLGIIAELPPDQNFAKQKGEESGRLDEIDDAYKVLYRSGGRWHYNHHHESELFPPEYPLPGYLEAQRNTILAGRKKTRKPGKFYQKTLFLEWMKEKRHLFSHEPYLAEERSYCFSIRFRGVDSHISCFFNDYGGISVTVDYRNQNYDTIMEFDLYEEETPEGRYLCSSCRDYPNEDNPPEVIEYENRAELWIKHSFEKLAAYTREEFTDDALLCLCRYGGSTAAFVASGKKLEKLRKREDFFKEIPVVKK
ncbi:MAG TPA: hypothetical protein HPP94_09505 [Desulfuromonadales bacterium]|nr:hypothetical protein [Desulfuromonadales bacterium]